MIDYLLILSTKYADQAWSLNGDSYDGLTWLSDTTQPTQSELDALWPLVQQEIADKKTAKEQAKASALTKLGLTADEIAALFGQ